MTKNMHERGIEAATCAVKDAAEDVGIEMGGYRARFYAKAAISAYLSTAEPSSKELEAAYLEGWKDAKSADRGETPEQEWLLSETYCAALRNEGVK